MAKIAFIGIGVMGGPMARHLGTTGHSLALYNRTATKTETWLQDNPSLASQTRIAPTPAEAAEDADVVITCVGDDDDLSQAVLGRQGVFASLGKDKLFVDHTTVSARIARQISVEGKSKRILCLDAPVSGGQAGAEKGVLSIMCGGSPEAMSAARPIIDCYAGRIVHVGGPGAGQNTKMVNQIAIAGILGGLSEAMRFAQASGLDLDKVFSAVSGGAAQSWQMDNRWDTMAGDSFDFGFAIDWMRKDLGLALDEARNNGATLPVAALIDQFYAEVQQAGGGRKDTSGLITRIARK
jgi:3-hydroxyisobutyrate dehydrogenase